MRLGSVNTNYNLGLRACVYEFMNKIDMHNYHDDPANVIFVSLPEIRSLQCNILRDQSKSQRQLIWRLWKKGGQWVKFCIIFTICSPTVLGSGGIEKSHSCKWAKWIQWHALPHIQQSTQQWNKGHYPNLHGWDFSIPPSPCFVNFAAKPQLTFDLASPYICSLIAKCISVCILLV